MYNHFTYGELTIEVVVEGLALCNDLKLKHQMDKERVQNKRAIGDFCEQFGYSDILKDSSHQKMRPNKKRWLKRPSKWSKKPSYKARNDALCKNKPKNPTCYKFGIKGHYNNYCRTQRKINELEIDEKLKRKLSQILLTNESEGD